MAAATFQVPSIALTIIFPIQDFTFSPSFFFCRSPSCSIAVSSSVRESLSRPERAARIMAATAEASPDLKHLAGGAATGRKLEKPVCQLFAELGQG